MGALLQGTLADHHGSLLSRTRAAPGGAPASPPTRLGEQARPETSLDSGEPVLTTLVPPQLRRRRLHRIACSSVEWSRRASRRRRGDVRSGGAGALARWSSRLRTRYRMLAGTHGHGAEPCSPAAGRTPRSTSTRRRPPRFSQPCGAPVVSGIALGGGGLCSPTVWSPVVPWRGAARELGALTRSATKWPGTRSVGGLSSTCCTLPKTVTTPTEAHAFPMLSLAAGRRGVGAEVCDWRRRAYRWGSFSWRSFCGTAPERHQSSRAQGAGDSGCGYGVLAADGAAPRVVPLLVLIAGGAVACAARRAGCRGSRAFAPSISGCAREKRGCQLSGGGWASEPGLLSKSRTASSLTWLPPSSSLQSSSLSRAGGSGAPTWGRRVRSGCALGPKFALRQRTPAKKSLASVLLSFLLGVRLWHPDAMRSGLLEIRSHRSCGDLIRRPPCLVCRTWLPWISTCAGAGSPTGRARGYSPTWKSSQPSACGVSGISRTSACRGWLESALGGKFVRPVLVHFRRPSVLGELSWSPALPGPAALDTHRLGSRGGVCVCPDLVMLSKAALGRGPASRPPLPAGPEQLGTELDDLEVDYGDGIPATVSESRFAAPDDSGGRV